MVKNPIFLILVAIAQLFKYINLFASSEIPVTFKLGVIIPFHGIL